jgi:hypothetical protein
MAKPQRGTDFDSVNTSSRKDRVKLTDLITLYKFPEKKWVTLRLFGAVHSYATAWITSVNKEGKKVKFPVELPSYDPETQQFDSTKYDPWNDYALFEKNSGIERDKQLVQVGRKFYANALFRHLQKQQPSTRIKPTPGERESGFKDKDSDTWTPWQAVALPAGVIQKIKELKGLNTFTSKKTGATKTYSVADEKFGRDIRVLYDSSKAPADQYQVVPGDKRTPLTEEELAFLRWDTSILGGEIPEDKETKTEFESWAKRMKIKLKNGKPIGADDIDEDDDEDEDDKPSKSKKKAPAKSKAKSKRDPDEDEDDEDEDDGLDEDDEDEDDKPAKSKKKPVAKSKKKDPDEDEDEDDEDSDEDDDEDSEDDEDELDDDEDEDDVKPSKSKKKPAPKSKAKSKSKSEEDDEDDEEDEDEDEDSDDEDEDEDDEDVKPSKSKAKSKAPAKSKAKSKRDPDEDEDDEDEDLDDEDDDLEDDEDEDEDEKPAPKKKAPVKTAKAKRK